MALERWRKAASHHVNRAGLRRREPLLPERASRGSFAPRSAPAQDNTRQKILAVAEDLLRERGFNGTSYTDISKLVKIRAASIHHHFPTKQTLIKEIVLTHGGEFFEKLSVASDQERGIEALSAYLALFHESFSEGQGGFICLFGMLGAEINSLDHAVAAEVRAFYERNIAELARIVEQGMTDGSIRSIGSPRSLARVIFSSVEGAMIIARAEGGMRSFRSVTSHIMRLVEAPERGTRTTQ